MDMTPGSIRGSQWGYCWHFRWKSSLWGRMVLSFGGHSPSWPPGPNGEHYYHCDEQKPLLPLYLYPSPPGGTLAPTEKLCEHPSVKSYKGTEPRVVKELV